jgi:hypothetical protein
MSIRPLEIPPTMDRFGQQVAQILSTTVDDLPYDVSERLRAARVRAIDKRKWVLMQSATEVFGYSHNNTLTVGHGHPHTSWWNRLGGAGLALILAGGLFAINVIQDELGAQELAEIDAAILTDDLPPAAYVDPGFAQFLKLGRQLD